MSFKKENGFSLIELSIVVALVGITTLALMRLSSFMIQSNNGLTFRMQRVELDRNLRNLYFNGDHCGCAFNAIRSPFNAQYDLTDRDFVIRRDPTTCDSPILHPLLTDDANFLGYRATSIRLVDLNFLGDPAVTRKAMGRLEYTLFSSKEILGPKSYTDSILITMNLQDSGGGAYRIVSCGKQPPDDIVAGELTARLLNSSPAQPLSADFEGNDTGFYLAQLHVVSANNPRFEFFAPPITPTSRPIDTYDLSTGTDGHIREKSFLVTVPVFSGFVYYKQSNGDSRTQLTLLTRVALPYTAETPAVQFPHFRDTTPPLIRPAGSSFGIPVRISQPNPAQDVVVRYTVAQKSAHLQNIAAPADYTLPADQTLTFPMGTSADQLIPVTIGPANTGQVKHLIIRLAVESGGILNYPNEFIVRFQD